jgi:hypothetical protein
MEYNKICLFILLPPNNNSNVNDAWKEVVSVPGDGYILLLQILKQGSEDDLRFCLDPHTDAVWGRGMAADYDQRSCLKSGGLSNQVPMIKIQR